MLEVAFSRRICCSRVESVSVNALFPSESVVSPTIRPGMERTKERREAKKPTWGPPKEGVFPKDCASPTTISAPLSPGGLSSAKERGSGTA